MKNMPPSCVSVPAIERSRLARVVRAGLAGSILMLGACVSDHPEIPSHELPAANGKGVSAKVATDIGDKERASGNPAGAVGFYQRALAIDPAQPKVRLSMGRAMLDAGMPNEAVETFRNILATSPRDSEAQIGLGMALVPLGQPAAAIDPLRKGLAAAPDPRGYRLLGVAENLLGQNAEAEADYNRGLALAPGDQALTSNLGLSLALSGNFNGAIAILRAAAADPRATARTRQNLALALGLAGRNEEAEQVARMDLDEASVQSNLAYYAQLRALSPKERTAALLRPAAPIQAPTKPTAP
jgi:Flp pilus assembly protein TadD